jgi:hypothetical protein
MTRNNPIAKIVYPRKKKLWKLATFLTTSCASYKESLPWLMILGRVAQLTPNENTAIIIELNEPHAYPIE